MNLEIGDQLTHVARSPMTINTNSTANSSLLITLIPSTVSFISNSSPSPSFRLNLQHLKSSSSVLCSSINSSVVSMDSTAATSVYPLHRTKTIHLVRHAQGIQNVEGEKDHSAYLSQELFDAHLTPLG